MMRKTIIILVSVMLTGCTLPFLDMVAGIDYGSLDYTTLFTIAKNLIVNDETQNIEGLTALLGNDNTSKLMTWYKSTLLAIQAGKAIVSGIRSRDLRISEIEYQYCEVARCY